MNSLNRFQLIGRVGNLVQSQNYTIQRPNAPQEIGTVVTFSLVQDNPKDKQAPLTFIIESWSSAAVHLRTGRLVFVEGTLVPWQTEEGQRGINFQSQRLQFLDRKDSQYSNGNRGGQAAQSAQRSRQPAPPAPPYDLRHEDPDSYEDLDEVPLVYPD